jgi:hypothetical protein
MSNLFQPHVAGVYDMPEKLCKVLLADNAKQLGKCVTIYGRQA